MDTDILSEDSREQELSEINDYLKKLKFHRQLIGGLDSVDVWNKIRKLDELYSQLMNTQKLQYEALLRDREQQLDELKDRSVRNALGYGDNREDE